MFQDGSVTILQKMGQIVRLQKHAMQYSLQVMCSAPPLHEREQMLKLWALLCSSSKLSNVTRLWECYRSKDTVTKSLRSLRVTLDV